MKTPCAVLLAVLAGPLPAQAPAVRDSAGIHIVTNPAFRAAPEVFRFNPAPIVDVGGLEDEPDLEFTSNQGYLRGVALSDGTLVVTDVWRVQFFDRQGRRLGIVGTRGEGPGEFRYLMGICRTRGDTVVVYDSHNARNVVIAPTRRIVRTFPSEPSGRLTFSSCFDDGTVVLAHSAYDRTARTTTTQYARARLDGTVTNPLLAQPPSRFDPVTGAEDAVATGGQRFYHSTRGSSEITAYTPAGRPALIIRYASTPERITDADALRKMPYSMLNGVKPSDAEIAAQRAEELKRWKSGPHAEFWPTHGRIHLDDDGRLWVNVYRVDYSARDSWIAFAPDGRMLGKLVLPEGRFEVVGFGKGTVLVRTWDEAGATHLSLHDIGGAE